TLTGLFVLLAAGVLLGLAAERERQARREAALARTRARLERSRAQEADARSSASQARAELAATQVRAARTAADVNERLERQHFYATQINMAWQALQADQVLRARQFLRD